LETRRIFLIAGSAAILHNDPMKKFFAFIVAGISAWVLFTPFDLPPVPFFFIDEAIALLLFTKSMAYLGFDISRFLPFLQNRNRKSPSPGSPAGQSGAAKKPVIDV
jgi:hypothetical protein